MELPNRAKVFSDKLSHHMTCFTNINKFLSCLVHHVISAWQLSASVPSSIAVEYTKVQLEKKKREGRGE
jgi:hypothetical protein